VLDAQDTWVQLELRDAQGRVVGEAGGRQEATGDDPTAHRLRALQVDDSGAPLLLRETDRFRTPVYNHTILPRDAEVVRFRFDVPATFDARRLPLRVTARLRHRSRDLALARATCADASTPRGAEFARQVRLRTGAEMDACAREPVTDIARGEVWLGAGSEGRRQEPAMPAWRRLYDRGLGLLHAQQEAVDSARASFERALELVPATPGLDADGDRVRAVILGALAQAAVREGRTEDALGLLEDAQRFAPDHPAIAHIRGQALSDVWRWSEATGPLTEAALASARDDTLWAHLAIAYGSAGDPHRALDAATHALELAPRDADALRVQALALERLGAPAESVTRARDAFDRWRPPDDAPAFKNRCATRSSSCALERLPVHVHEVRPAP
jgi:tetratricopeptide (TPR) repeat protein